MSDLLMIQNNNSFYKVIRRKNFGIRLQRSKILFRHIQMARPSDAYRNPAGAGLLLDGNRPTPVHGRHLSEQLLYSAKRSINYNFQFKTNQNYDVEDGPIIDDQGLQSLFGQQEAFH